jgi:hypothetical protein
MKKTLLIIVACLVSLGVNSQNGKKFKYEKSQFGAYVVTPIFDQSKGEGKIGVASFSNPFYISDVFDKITKQVITKEKVDSLYSDASYYISLSSKGEIINCWFSLNGKDLNVISDDDFYKLYRLIKKTKIDMSIVKIGLPDSYTQDTTFDYTVITGTLIPKDLRNKFKKHN